LILSGAGIQTAGFVIAGDASRQLLVRGIGPELSRLFPATFPANSVLTDPLLTVFTGNQVILTNDNWNNQALPEKVFSAAAQVGAFPLSSGSLDAAFVYPFKAGSYTIQFSGKNNTTGIGLLELYDMESFGSTRLINLSTLGNVDSGQALMIAGIVVKDGSRRLLIRGVGPGLASLVPAVYSAANVLPNPQIKVINSSGVQIASNDDWGSSSVQETNIKDAQTRVGAFPLQTGSKDAALLLTLEPGNYTVLVTDTADKPGIAIVEVYDVP
jgi:hypothetical protein